MQNQPLRLPRMKIPTSPEFKLCYARQKAAIGGEIQRQQNFQNYYILLHATSYMTDSAFLISPRFQSTYMVSILLLSDSLLSQTAPGSQRSEPSILA